MVIAVVLLTPFAQTVRDVPIEYLRLHEKVNRFIRYLLASYYTAIVRIRQGCSSLELWCYRKIFIEITILLSGLVRTITLLLQKLPVNKLS